MTTCANCGTTQGPFDRSAGVGPICAPTPQAQYLKGTKNPAIRECVSRRTALDSKRYGA